MVKVSVKDFGPIIEGAVELKPLTIFVGPNNSGKSYMAMLMYALMHSAPLGGYFDDILSSVPRRFRSRLIRMRRGFWNEQEDEAMSEFGTWLENHSDEVLDKAGLQFASLPRKFKQTLEKDAEMALDRRKDSLRPELSRCFGSGLTQLSRGKAHNGFNVSLEHNNPKWSMNISPDENLNSDKVQVALLTETFELLKNHLTRLEDYTRRGSSTLENTKVSLILLAPEIFEEVFEQLFPRIYRQFPSNCYYLPAERSGMLQGYKLLASEIVRRAPSAGIEPLPDLRLTGAVADFISGLLYMDSKYETDLFEIATFLEREIAKGRIYRQATSTNLEYPEIYYESHGQQFLMHQTSSMVSELAPYILYLKHTVRSGDLLIIEEPESHLHPANQRRLAQAIVKMVRKGLKVMLTTHSDFFLSQLSNFVRLSELEAERAKMNYGEDDFLKAEEVGCYLFEWDDAGVGSVIRELQVDAENGIPEDEFYAVSEALYNEHVDIERARMKVE